LLPYAPTLALLHDLARLRKRLCKPPHFMQITIIAGHCADPATGAAEILAPHAALSRSGQAIDRVGYHRRTDAKER